MKAYIAAPIFTPEQLDVVSKLSSCVPDHWEIFSPYEASREIWKGRRPADCSPKERLKVTRQNYENVADSDVIICWLNGRHPDGRADTGVTWEMGFGYAVSFLQHRPEPVQIGFLHNWFAMPKDLNLMLTGTLDALVDTYAKLQIALDFLDNETTVTPRCLPARPRRRAASSPTQATVTSPDSGTASGHDRYRLLLPA
jgi:hypothetical protein